MTGTLTRILVPMDFSPPSECALDAACALAARLNASLDLLHVVDDPFGSGAWNSETAALPRQYIDELYATLLGEAERRLTPYLVLAKKAGLNASMTVRTGQPASFIVEFAAANRCDLIVMGTHGRTGITHAFMGSVAERVIQRASCPVVTVRDTGATGRGTGVFAPAQREIPLPSR